MFEFERWCGAEWGVQLRSRLSRIACFDFDRGVLGVVGAAQRGELRARLPLPEVWVIGVRWMLDG